MVHPTINLIQSPETGCPQPAYNCVKYCFDATDFQTQVGTKAEFTIEKNAIIAGYGAGVVFIIAGQNFTTGTQNSYNEINTVAPQTAAQMAQNFKDALESNSYLFSTFSFVIVADVLIATAREVGIINNFVFDYTATAQPPVNTDTQGIENIYRENYRLAVEIWCRTWDVVLMEFVESKISTEAYIPDSEGNICINVGEKIAPFLETLFVYNQLQTAAYDDNTIYKPIFLRYGEIYSDVVGDCEVTSRDFVSSEVVTVINSAFQRGEEVAKTALMCAHNWMTNAPQFTEVSLCSEFVLWASINDILPPPPTAITVSVIYIITYTDGTTSTHSTGTVYKDFQYLQIIARPVGSTLINIFSNPSKVVDYYEVQIVQTDDSIPPVDVVYASQFFKVVSCCRTDVEFYFLNEYGGRDAILFTQVDSIELEQSNAIFESFLDCEDPNALAGGKATVDQTANDVFEVTSKFVDSYQQRRWIREFLTSPQKAVRTTIETEDEILSNVIVLTGSVKYFVKDESIYLRLQYILNESINLQKN